MKKDLSRGEANPIEHLKFEIAQEYGLTQKSDKKTKKNIKNS